MGFMERFNPFNTFNNKEQSPEEKERAEQKRIEARKIEISQKIVSIEGLLGELQDSVKAAGNEWTPADNALRARREEEIRTLELERSELEGLVGAEEVGV
jgi:hypothetical protein